MLRTFSSLFYDNSILPGTKIVSLSFSSHSMFYDNSILPGTKIIGSIAFHTVMFYDNSILPGTKIESGERRAGIGFTITQFFQVLKFNTFSASSEIVLR